MFIGDTFCPKLPCMADLAMRQLVPAIIYCVFDDNIRGNPCLGSLCNHVEDIFGSTNQVGKATNHNITTNDEAVEIRFRGIYPNRP